MSSDLTPSVCSLETAIKLSDHLMTKRRRIVQLHVNIHIYMGSSCKKLTDAGSVNLCLAHIIGRGREAAFIADFAKPGYIIIVAVESCTNSILILEHR